jgi:precorrin-4/cobalt-precorrin-4 C11-methyltransferase
MKDARHERRDPMTLQKHSIIFCGAGPGDPELITVKGMKALESADLVLYAGSLVPEAVLTWAPTRARRISSAGMDLEQIIATMAEAYEDGQRVVRLHTGDPSLYGAIGEQMAALNSRNIPFRVIPGVTAAFAAAAAMGIEYTVPEITQTLILTRMAGRTPVPEAEALASLARHGASMVIYLSMALIDEVADVLSKAYGPEAQCAVAYRVSHPEEKIFTTPLERLAASARAEGINRLAVILVGPALAHPRAIGTLRSKLYDKEFLHGYRPEK